jgi:hypothetical protein
MKRKDGYIYYEFVEKKSSSIHYKTWVCMGEVIVSESKPEVRYYNHQPLGNNRYLRYSTYHSTKLNNIKADEKEQKQGYVELDSVKSVIDPNSSSFWKAFKSEEYSSSLSKELLKRLKPYLLQCLKYVELVLRHPTKKPVFHYFLFYHHVLKETNLAFV